MVQSVEIETSTPFQMEDFLRELDLKGAAYVCSSASDEVESHYFYFEDSSTTLFVIDIELGKISLGIDGLAAWDDYKRFPYILDTLCEYLTGGRYTWDGQNAYQCFDEDWIADSMGEEVACLKAWLTVNERYYLSLPINEGTYVTKEILREHGVCLHSSTPRIYGYIHYFLAYDTIPAETGEVEMDELEDGELEVPQHVSIGRVKSWMLDGSETWESYSREDVDLLLEIAESYKLGNRAIKGVVLNDIGTIYQMGIGVKLDGHQAAFWFRRGYEQGDHWFSPTNLGDLYRKGCGELPPDLQLAFDAYSLSSDPYAWYRIGQAWEEGWNVGKHDMETAQHWYEKAAEAGHHLAIKALKRLKN